MSFARQSAAKTAVCVCACRYLCRWSWNSRPELDPLPLRGGIIVEFDGFFLRCSLSVTAMPCIFRVAMFYEGYPAPHLGIAVTTTEFLDEFPS